MNKRIIIDHLTSWQWPSSWHTPWSTDWPSLQSPAPKRRHWPGKCSRPRNMFKTNWKLFNMLAYAYWINMQFFLVANSCRDFIVLLNRIDIHFITTKRNLIYAFHPSGTAFLIACSCSALWASISFCLHFSWNAISIFLIAKKTGIPPNTNDKKRPLENKENTCNNHCSCF